VADIVAKVFSTFRRATLIQDQARTRNNDSKKPAAPSGGKRTPSRHKAGLNPAAQHG
jgi:hypothetical protein